MSVMALQGRKSSPQKSRPLESGNRRHAVWIAIEYSYKLGQKNEFKFWCELGWFLQRQSQMITLGYISRNGNGMHIPEVNVCIHILAKLLATHYYKYNSTSTKQEIDQTPGSVLLARSSLACH